MQLQAPWDTWVKRVYIHTPQFLDPIGRDNIIGGGRKRLVRDIALLIRDVWKRDVVVVQKAQKKFEAVSDEGLSVIGCPVGLSAWGDISLGRQSRGLVKKDETILYGSAEDAWPYFIPQSKGIQHGIWWDGPYSRLTRMVARIRSLSLVRAVRSLWCVDTNFINWLRGFGRKGVELCNKCVYFPNYADLELVKVATDKSTMNSPMRMIYARRFDPRRGPYLFLEALKLLKTRNTQFHLDFCTIGGLDYVKNEILAMGLADQVNVFEKSLDDILGMYQNADISVVPTIWSEGTSLSCVESICAGVPVITTPVGGLGNLIVPGFNGLIFTPTAQSLADAVDVVSNSPEEWKSMREHCLSMRESFSKQRWEANALTWLKS